MYGDEDQVELMNLIKNHKGENEIMENRIAEITRDIEAYEEAIENAEGALAEAERELNEELQKYVDAEDEDIESYPEYNKD